MSESPDFAAKNVMITGGLGFIGSNLARRLVELGAHVFHQYAVCLPQRGVLRTYLRQAGIGTLIHYPVPVHLQPAYQDRLPLVATLPWTEQVARQVLSLPIYPQLSDDQVRRVSHEIVRFLEDKVAEV